MKGTSVRPRERRHLNKLSPKFQHLQKPNQLSNSLETQVKQRAQPKRNPKRTASIFNLRKFFAKQFHRSNTFSRIFSLPIFNFTTLTVSTLSYSRSRYLRKSTNCNLKNRGKCSLVVSRHLVWFRSSHCRDS